MENTRQGSARRPWLLWLCCLLPIGILLFVVVSQIRGNYPAFSWAWLVFLICPLMHLWMFSAMREKGGSCHDTRKEVERTG